MVPNHNGFVNNLPELSAKELKKGGGVSFLSKRERLEMQLERLEEKKNKLELAKQKKQADLMLMEDEDSDEDFFKYRISSKDYDLLQQAKAQGMQQQELG
jgi:LAS superfamily LD-carboxypeptidase LdcB